MKDIADETTTSSPWLCGCVQTAMRQTTRRFGHIVLQEYCEIRCGLGLDTSEWTCLNPSCIFGKAALPRLFGDMCLPTYLIKRAGPD